MRLPSNTEIERHLLTADFASFRYNKFYLSLVEEHISKFRPPLADKNLQLEHIMPRSLRGWKQYLGENAEQIRDEYVNNIGNLTLIRHNQELGTKSFNEKKQIYDSMAGLQIARTKITDKSFWKEKEIKERRDWLIKYFTEKLFPIPAIKTNSEAVIPEGSIYYLNDDTNDLGKAKGIMEYKDGYFIVKAGSICTPSNWEWRPEYYKKAKFEANRLIEDVYCTSPSAAGWIVLGRSNNGWTMWKNKAGEPLDIYR